VSVIPLIRSSELSHHQVTLALSKAAFIAIERTTIEPFPDNVQAPPEYNRLDKIIYKTPKVINLTNPCVRRIL